MQKTTVLFLCTGNSARSQMAEHLLRGATDAFEVHSAGTDPKGVNPLTVQVMSELGVDMSQARSKHLSEFRDQPVSVLITVCAEADKSCPVGALPQVKHRLAWKFDDPAEAKGTQEEKLAVFRRIRDQIAERITEWLKEARAD
ncbi:MAG: arsenate reductase ArsC [Gemmataceae bacterium]|nr:arsenate reductase ArsC [Gemmataceae bacterium]MCI0741638.1 arsenate reductase ArsC [Gemmataceae bacterium]